MLFVRVECFGSFLHGKRQGKLWARRYHSVFLKCHSFQSLRGIRLCTISFKHSPHITSRSTLISRFDWKRQVCWVWDVPSLIDYQKNTIIHCRFSVVWQLALLFAPYSTYLSISQKTSRHFDLVSIRRAANGSTHHTRRNLSLDSKFNALSICSPIQTTLRRYTAIRKVQHSTTSFSYIVPYNSGRCRSTVIIVTDYVFPSRDQRRSVCEGTGILINHSICCWVREIVDWISEAKCPWLVLQELLKHLDALALSDRADYARVLQYLYESITMEVQLGGTCTRRLYVKFCPLLETQDAFQAWHTSHLSSKLSILNRKPLKDIQNFSELCETRPIETGKLSGRQTSFSRMHYPCIWSDFTGATFSNNINYF